MPKKITSTLASQLQTADDSELLDLVVELAPQPPPDAEDQLPRKDRIAARQAAFDRQSKPVKAAIEKEGGRVLNSVWLNNTLHVALAPSSVHRVAALEDVTAVDVPRPVQTG